MKVFLKTAVVLFLAFSIQAKAEHEGPCANDAKTLCPGIEHGDGRIMKCMHEHKDKLSVECKAHVDKMKSMMKEVKEACHGDVEKLCADVKKGGGRVMKCMKEHKDQLSETCKKEIEAKKSARKKDKAGK